MIKKYFITILILIVCSFSQINNQKVSSFIEQVNNYKIEDVSNTSRRTLAEANKIRLEYIKLNEQEKSVIKNVLKTNQYNSLFKRPVLEKSIISPKGYFRIHYDTTGYNKPAYNVNDFAKEADFIFEYYHNTLKYNIPPRDDNEGGDNKYDIYIKYISDWGVTWAEKQVGNEKYTSYMEIDNDFSDKRTKGFDAAKITIAHEYHHAIQMGNYIFSDDVFMHELTSTTMEDVVYDEVNDYYFEVGYYFNKTNKKLTSNDGYNLTVLGIFLIEKFGIVIIKDIWELMPSNNGITSIKKAVEKKGTSFSDFFAEFGVWCFFTNERTIEGKYFKDAIHYPLVKPLETINLIVLTEKMVNLEPVSLNYICFKNTSNNYELTTLFTNSDSDSIKIKNTTKTRVDYSANLDEINNSIYFDNGFYFKNISINPNYIKNNYFLNDDKGYLLFERPNYANTTYPYPQPFSYKKETNIIFPFDYTHNEKVEFKIYNSAMELVYSTEATPIKTEAKKAIIYWNAMNNSNSKLATGIYFYVIKSKNDVFKGKIAVIND